MSSTSVLNTIKENINHIYEQEAYYYCKIVFKFYESYNHFDVAFYARNGTEEEWERVLDQEEIHVEAEDFDFYKGYFQALQDYYYRDLKFEVKQIVY